MEEKQPIYYDDLFIKLNFDSHLINILSIRYEPPLPTWNVGNHCHSSHELHFIPCGKGILRVNRDKYDIAENTFYVTGPNVYHEQITDKSNPMAEFSISFEMIHIKKLCNTKQHNSSEMETIKSVFDSNSFWIGRDEYSNIELFENIFWELENKQVGYYFNVQSLIIQIIVNSARCCMLKKESIMNAPKKTTDDRRRFILDFYFGEHYKTLTIDQLSSKLGVSKRQLNRIIKQYYNTTYNDKLMSTRLDNAVHLLENTDLSVEKICENIGFSNTSYFHRCFKTRYGITPREFKNKNRKTT